MTRVLSACYVALVVGHGLIHLMGTVEGYGGDVPQLSEPVGPGLGTLWLLAAVLVVASAGLFVFRHEWWWAVTALAALASQALILTSWADAKAGTVVNAVMLLAAGSGFVHARTSRRRA